MRRLFACALLAVALSGPAGPVRADRLHLESGGVIETADWWILESVDGPEVQCLTHGAAPVPFTAATNGTMPGASRRSEIEAVEISIR